MIDGDRKNPCNFGVAHSQSNPVSVSCFLHFRCRARRDPICQMIIRSARSVMAEAWQYIYSGQLLILFLLAQMAPIFFEVWMEASMKTMADFSSSKTTSFTEQRHQDVIRCLSSQDVRDSWRVIHTIQCLSCRTPSEFANPHCPGRNCAIDRALGEANPHAFARHVHLPSEGMSQQPGNLPIFVDCTRLKTEMLEVFEII